jgi:hypothetical protein
MAIGGKPLQHAYAGPDASDRSGPFAFAAAKLYASAMQIIPSALVPLLLLLCAFEAQAAEKAPAKAPAIKPVKTHAVTLGPVHRVPYTPPDTPADATDEDSITLKVRPLFVDGHQKEWTTGDLHDVTDRSFTIRRALRLNDALPSDKEPHWVWQPGPWLLVDRATGHVAALHLPDFDAAISNVVWFRDYAAYCGIATTVRGGLVAVVAQAGARKAVAQRPLGAWPQASHATPVCQAATWQRLPMRATIQPTGGEAVTFDVIGTSSLIEEGDPDAP